MCLIDPANRASARVADKLGYRAIERTTYLERDTIVYERRP
jgi:RimJ/RimL family protein N-acetyltransferase